VAELVAPRPKSFAIDACAGAGARPWRSPPLSGQGKVLAIDASRGSSTSSGAGRGGRRVSVQAVVVDLLAPATRSRLTWAAPRGSSSTLLAPDSGDPAQPGGRWRFDPGALARMATAQAALLEASARLVAPRGRLVYATCSFLPSEGERQTEAFFAGHPEFSLVTVRDVLGRARTEPFATADGKYLRTWRLDGAPDGGDAGMDGFFASVARRASA